jgi:hypothetical protein
MRDLYMNQDKPEEIVVITSQDGVWREEKVPLTGLGLISLAVKFEGEKDPDIERTWSPFQWGRMFKEKLYPGFEESMKELRIVDDRITQFSKELNYLADLMPNDPTKLADIALILIEIQQRLSSIVEAGSQVKPFKDRRVSDFYGRFHVKIPENLRTSRASSEDDDGKVATAGLIGDFVDFIGKAIFEYTDAETREMKRVVKHLMETTKQTVSSVNRTLNDMLDARKTGDIDKYIELIKFIGKEQAELRKEFDVVYDAYLKEPHERALQLEAQAEAEAKARGEKYQKTHEELSAGEDGLTVVEVDDPAPEEAAPLEAAEDAEEPPTALIPGGTGAAQMRHPESGMELSEPVVELGEGELTSEEQRAVEQARVPEAVVQPESGEEIESLHPDKPLPEPEVEEKAPITQRVPVLPPQPAEEPAQEGLIVAPTLEQTQQYGRQVRMQLETVLTKASHARFLNKLAKIAETENKYVVAAFMAKYSDELEDIDPEASAALLKAAQEISND